MFRKICVSGLFVLMTLACTTGVSAQQFYVLATPTSNGGYQVDGLLRIEIENGAVVVDLINASGHFQNLAAVMRLIAMNNSGAEVYSTSSIGGTISDGPIPLGGLYDTPTNGWGFMDPPELAIALMFHYYFSSSRDGNPTV